VAHLNGHCLKLTHRDAQASGKHHFLPLLLVVTVEQLVPLSDSAEQAKAQWEEEQKSFC